MTPTEALAPLRAIGTRLILRLLWINAALILPVAWATGAANPGAALAIALAMAAFPTVAIRQGLPDQSVRLMLGIATAIFPALYVLLFQGHAWQMDMHMYFFVSFTVLVLLCDWRPIIAATTVTALHHLLLLYVMPEWVFPGSGSLGRVLLHAGLVGAQATLLILIVARISDLKIRKAGMLAEMDQARRDAERARAEAQAALEKLRAAQAAADRFRAEKAAAEAALAASAAERRDAVAAMIEAKVGSLVTDIQRVAGTLAAQEGELGQVSTNLLAQSDAMSRASEQTVLALTAVAESAEQLAQSTRTVGSGAQEVHQVVATASTVVADLDPRIDELNHEITDARTILELVAAIAAQSNLLALNATIEAARSGEAGRGFGVVAQEMKQMASRTAAAAAEIAQKLDAIGGAARAFVDTIETTTGRIGVALDTATDIAAAARQQRTASDAIAANSEHVLRQVVDADVMGRALRDAATENREIAGASSALAEQLRDHAEALGDGVNALLRDLRAA